MNVMKEKKGVLTVVLTGFEDEETVRFYLNNALLFALCAMKIPKTLHEETTRWSFSLFVLLFYRSRAKASRTKSVLKRL